MGKFHIGQVKHFSIQEETAHHRHGHLYDLLQLSVNIRRNTRFSPEQTFHVATYESQPLDILLSSCCLNLGIWVAPCPWDKGNYSPLIFLEQPYSPCNLISVAVSFKDGAGGAALSIVRICSYFYVGANGTSQEEWNQMWISCSGWGTYLTGINKIYISYIFCSYRAIPKKPSSNIRIQWFDKHENPFARDLFR